MPTVSCPSGLWISVTPIAATVTQPTMTRSSGHPLPARGATNQVSRATTVNPAAATPSSTMYRGESCIGNTAKTPAKSAAIPTMPLRIA